MYLLIIHKNQVNEKKQAPKALKPSEMGLHSKVRYVIHLKSKTRKEQAMEIIEFATGLYDFIVDFIEQEKPLRMEITQKFARHVSKSYTFVGYKDDDIFSILLKASDIKRKP